MQTKIKPEQNHALVKVHQLLAIAKDIAYDANLTWLVEDVDKLDCQIRYFHKDANR